MNTPNNPDITTAKLRNSIYEIRLQMWQKGGEFVRSLSQTLGKSDLENQAKLIKAFPEIFEKLLHLKKVGFPGALIFLILFLPLSEL